MQEKRKATPLEFFPPEENFEVDEKDKVNALLYAIQSKQLNEEESNRRLKAMALAEKTRKIELDSQVSLLLLFFFWFRLPQSAQLFVLLFFCSFFFLFFLLCRWMSSRTNWSTLWAIRSSRTRLGSARLKNVARKRT